MTEKPEDWLGATGLIDVGHPTIQAVATDLSSGRRTDREKALAVFHFVRDEIKFGFALTALG